MADIAAGNADHYIRQIIFEMLGNDRGHADSLADENFESAHRSLKEKSRNKDKRDE